MFRHCIQGVFLIIQGVFLDCGPDWFICKDYSGCVPSEMVLDDVPDCQDESDEGKLCFTPNFTNQNPCDLPLKM